jgi:histidinol-phosphate aminotransferase
VLTDQRPARTIAVPRLGPQAGFALDIPAVRRAARDADVVWLCSPNNPTAQSEPRGAIAELLGGLVTDAVGAGRPAPVVILDEAYAEFTGSSLVGLRKPYPRLVVVRTASKAYGLAGLRVGFAVARPEMIAAMEPYRPPGSVSVLSVEIATHAFESDGWLEPRIEAIHRERDRFADGLTDLGWPPLPSEANFLLVPFGSADRAGRVAEALLQVGIVPRTFGSTHPLADHLRITGRSADQDDRFLAAARSIAAQEALAPKEDK